MAAPDRIKITHQRPMTTPTFRAATTSDDIPLGPFSEDDLRQQWNAQADEFNQWDSLDTSEQLAWAQARATAAVALKAEPETPATPPAIRTALERLIELSHRHATTSAWDGAFFNARAALKAEPEGEGPSLQWTDNMPPSETCRYDHCIAKTPFGRFLITWKSWNEYDSPTVDETPWGDWFGAFNSVDDAKAACQQGMNERLAQWGHPTTPPAPEPGEVPSDELMGQWKDAAFAEYRSGGEPTWRTSALLAIAWAKQQQAAELAALQGVPVAWCRSDEFENAMKRGGSFNGWKDPGAGAYKCDMQLCAIPLPAPQAGDVQPPHPTFLDAIRLAQGCHDYSGGHSGPLGDAFQDGVGTVVAVLKKAALGPWDSQTMAVFGVGSAPQAGEGEA